MKSAKKLSISGLKIKSIWDILSCMIKVFWVCVIYFNSPTLTPYFQFLSFNAIQTIDHFKLDFCRDILSIVVRSDMWQTSEENRKIFIEVLGIKWID